MNTQTELAQADVEIAELQAKLAKAQERRELLTLVKPAYDATLTQIDRVLDILLLVELPTEVRMTEVSKFKAAIEARFIPKSLEIGIGVTEATKPGSHWDKTSSRWISPEIKQTEIQSELAIQSEANAASEAAVQVSKAESKRKPSGYRAKVLADKCFPTRPAQKMQLQVIIQELEAIGIEVGTIISGSSDIKGWNLYWNGDKAGLFWTVGQGWEIEALTPGGRLTKQWEGFDLDDHLIANDIDLEEYVA